MSGPVGTLVIAKTGKPSASISVDVPDGAIDHDACETTMESKLGHLVAPEGAVGLPAAVDDEHGGRRPLGRLAHGAMLARRRAP